MFLPAKLVLWTSRNKKSPAGENVLNQRDETGEERNAKQFPAKENRQAKGNEIMTLSFVDALKENYKEFINQYLGLRQQL